MGCFIGGVMPEKIWVFDLDDTLYANHHDYDQSYIDFYFMMREKLGDLKAPLLHALTDIHVKRDSANVKKFKEEGRAPFGRDRFPTTFREVYIDFCEQTGTPWTEEEAQAAYEIGNLAFNFDRYKSKGLVAGAVETLDFLKHEKHDDIVVLTKGDKEIQDMKYNALRLNRWVPEYNFYVVPDKSSPDVFKNHITLFNVYTRAFHVGNGMNSDVFPALDAGLTPVYIPCESWWHERNGVREPTEEEQSRIITLDSISDIVTHYDTL